MLKVMVDNTPVYTPENTTLLEACEKLGVYVPRFCYHERLRVAGNCRMCLLEVEKAPKPVVSCAFPISNGMTVFTSSPLVRKARENVIEFLLINHPYDCPVCDQGGECDLQEQALKYGSDRTRFKELKRTVEDKKVGPIIKTIMTRCIHCTRCVRFLELIAGTEEFGTTTRGQDTEIGSYVQKQLSTELSGNLIDLCPVGALTSKPYAFSARPWDLKNVSTIDISDSIGSHITVGVKESTVVRITPLLCDEINGEWITDKTRFSFDGYNFQRLGDIFFKSLNGNVSPLTWKETLSFLKEKLSNHTEIQKKIVIVVGSPVDLESYYFLQLLNKKYQVPVLNEDFETEKTSSFNEFSKLNISMSELEQIDFFLGVGLNPRFEGSLFNVRLRHNFSQGITKYNFLAWPEDLTYSNKNWDNTLQTLFKIVEGRHTICWQLATAQFPFLTFGKSFLINKKSSILFWLVNAIAQKTNLITHKWLGLGVLSLTPNFTGKNIIGTLESKINWKKINTLFLVNLDNPETFFSKVESTCLKILITPIVLEKFFQPNTLLLPATNAFETAVDFVNLEGRFQQTRIVNKPSLEHSRDVKQFAKIFHQLIEKKEQQDNLKKIEKNYSSKFHKNNFKSDYNIFPKILKQGTKHVKNFFSVVKNKLVQPTVVNFYKTSLVTENSVVMSECSTQVFDNFSTFHFYKK